MNITKEFSYWASGYSGCDGGDIGNPSSPSVWFCGIEWGGGHNEASLRNSMSRDLETPPRGYDHEKDNLDCIFNRRVMKIIAAMCNIDVNNYKEVALTRKPFVQGSPGFFKMNLFPISFKNTNHKLWQDSFSKLTGFDNKAQYMSWCRQERFPKIQSWLLQYQPLAVICFGLTFSSDFKAAFANNDTIFITEEIDGKLLSWARHSNGSLIIICPFPVNRYGLNSNMLLQKFGNRISELLDKK